MNDKTKGSSRARQTRVPWGIDSQQQLQQRDPVTLRKSPGRPCSTVECLCRSSVKQVQGLGRAGIIMYHISHIFPVLLRGTQYYALYHIASRTRPDGFNRGRPENRFATLSSSAEIRENRSHRPSIMSTLGHDQDRKGGTSLPLLASIVLAVKLPSNHVRTHHFVVFMVDDVTVPDVSRAYCGVEGVEVDSW